MTDNVKIDNTSYLAHFPDCSQERKLCKFFEEGKCKILTDTHFKRECPFYKLRES